MLFTAQIVFVLLIAIAFVGMVAESGKNKALSQQLVAVLCAAILALAFSFYT